MQTGFYLAEGLAGWDQPVLVADGLGQLTQELVGKGMATALYHLPAKKRRSKQTVLDFKFILLQ
jgi:hypothetical protein